MAVTSVGDLFIGGYRGDSALIMRVDPLGHPVWSRTFRSTNAQREIVNQLTITPDGYLIGSGDSYGGSPAMYRSVLYFKFDLDGNAQWIRSSADPRPAFSFALLPRTTEEYVLVDEVYDLTSPTFADPLSHGVNASDGTIIWAAPRLDYIPQNSYIDDAYGATIGSGGTYYTTGRIFLAGSAPGSMRSFISKFTSNGSHEWTRYHLIPGSSDARIYGCDIITSTDSLLVCYTGDITQYSSTFRVGLIRTDTSGITAWAKDYDITEFGSEIAVKVLRMPYGYAITGRSLDTDPDLFVLAVSLQGEVLWAKRYGSPFTSDKLLHSYLKNSCAIGSDVVFTGEREEGGDSDIALYRIDSTGSIACGGSSNLTVIETDGPTFSQSLDPQSIPDAIAYVPVSNTSWSLINNECLTTTGFLGNDTTACSAIMLDASPSEATAYQWQDGSTNATFTATGPGTYWVIASSDCCISSDTVVVTGGAPPTALFEVQIDPCLFDATFNNMSIHADQFEWQFGDGTTSSEVSPVNTYDSTGSYTVSLIASNACGNDTSSLTIGIGALGMIALQGPALICDGEQASYSVTVHGVGMDDVTWSTGDNTSSILLSLPVDQLLSVAVTGSDGCLYAAALNVQVIGLAGEAAAYVPNVFTPNGDGLNETLAPVLSDPETLIELLIFNRWGQEIFTTTSVQQPWNGKVEGGPVPDGTYIYIVRWKDRCTGTRKEKYGHVTLLR